MGTRRTSQSEGRLLTILAKAPPPRRETLRPRPFKGPRHRALVGAHGQGPDPETEAPGAVHAEVEDRLGPPRPPAVTVAHRPLAEEAALVPLVPETAGPKGW